MLAGGLAGANASSALSPAKRKRDRQEGGGKALETAITPLRGPRHFAPTVGMWIVVLHTHPYHPDRRQGFAFR
jgi:hypothetical protein